MIQEPPIFYKGGYRRTLTDSDKYLLDRNGFSPGVRFCTVDEVSHRKRFYAFPWSAFLCAEGDNDEITALFVTHSVTVQGDGLLSVLNALQNQKLVWLEPSERSAKFERKGGEKEPLVSRISVEAVSGKK